MKTFYSIIKNTINQQKKNITLVFISACFFTSLINAQISAGAPANFGIDGDVKNDYRMSGSFTAAGTHDWFKLIAGTGIGVIDTTNTNSYRVSLAAGNNIVFDKGMSVARYSAVDGKLLLDARYARDQFGNGTSAATMDYTSFITAKNGDNPTTWSTVPTGAAVSDKNDIVDAFMHMRRDGTVITAPSPSHLIANVGISTVGNTGTRYFDAELYCSKIAYNTSTGVFSNSGPAATGGHTAWTFNADGTIKQFGDVTISFAFTSGICNEIYAMIWVSQTTFLTVNPAGFDFVSGEYYGAVLGYGYAKIKPNSGSATIWGIANTAVGTTPPWGTNSKTLGDMSLNYYSTSYDIGQFGEAAIDLTELGVDPALMSGNNPCSPPFSRILFKSRASSSFTAALKDFAGPYEFLDAPAANPAVASPQVLSCQTSSVTLQPQNIQAGNYYHWSTTNGNIVSNPDSTYLTVNKPGKYYLQAAIYQGCSANIDSVIILKDSLQPVATAGASGALNVYNPTVVLYGGDPVASNTPTSFGGSLGLTYSWTGPAGFTSSIRNPSTSQEGSYQLIVTEIRNGCTDTAATLLLRIFGVPLPVKLISFQGNLNNKKVTLNWTTATNEAAERFEVERSSDGINFSATGIVSASDKKDNESYMFNENLNDISKIYYRLKMYDKSQKIDYSKVLVFQTKTNTTNEIKILNNLVTDKLTFGFQSDNNQPIEVKIFDMAGRIQLSKKLNAYQGSNLVSLPLTSAFATGIYVLDLSNGAEHFTAKFIRQ
jgi:hypothetical protein